MKSYPLREVDRYTNFNDFIEGNAKKYGDSPALSWFDRKANRNDVSFNKLRDDVMALKSEFIRMGFADKHIAILGENSYEWLLVYFAATCSGAIAVSIDVEQSTETLLQMLEMSKSDVIFYADAYNEFCQSEFAGKKALYGINTKNSDVLSVKMLVDRGYENGICEYEGDRSPRKVASIVFTSGTTSTAKPVMLSHEAILTNAADAYANVEGGGITFTSLPFYHMYGMTVSVLTNMVAGAHLYINGNMKTVMRDMQLSNANTLMAVPLMLETIHRRLWAAAEESGKADALKKLIKIQKFLKGSGYKKVLKKLAQIKTDCFGSINYIFCGGAYINADIMDEFHNMGITIFQGYGITECSPLVSVNRNKANKLGSVGLVTANCEVKIEDGEILVRGKNLMNGYFCREDLTRDVMKDDWFCTGDIGYLDKDGFLYITGRKKNLIVFKNGKKLSPEKIEEKIKTIGLVKDVMVYGAATGASTDDVQVAASIYPDKDKTAGLASYEILETLQKEIDVINKSLPMYQQIQMISIREQEFDKTALQKIKRHLA